MLTNNTITYHDDRTRTHRTVIYKDQSKMEVRIVDEHGDRCILTRTLAIPLAWVQNNDLLIASSDTGHEVQLLKWESLTGRIDELAEFKASTMTYQSCTIIQAVPNTDGTIVAMFVLPFKGRFADLWMLDLKSGACNMVKPGHLYGISGGFNSSIWQNGKFVYQNSREVWAINPDGSGLERIVDPEDLNR